MATTEEFFPGSLDPKDFEEPTEKSREKLRQLFNQLQEYAERRVVRRVSAGIINRIDKSRVGITAQRTTVLDSSGAPSHEVRDTLRVFYMDSEGGTVSFGSHEDHRGELRAPEFIRDKIAKWYKLAWEYGLMAQPIRADQATVPRRVLGMNWLLANAPEEVSESPLGYGIDNLVFNDGTTLVTADWCPEDQPEITSDYSKPKARLRLEMPYGSSYDYVKYVDGHESLALLHPGVWVVPGRIEEGAFVLPNGYIGPQPYTSEPRSEDRLETFDPNSVNYLSEGKLLELNSVLGVAIASGIRC